MYSLLLGFISVILFCVCAHFFARSILKPIPAPGQSPYSQKALRLGKQYFVFTMGLMTFVFLAGLVISFYQIFIQL